MPCRFYPNENIFQPIPYFQILDHLHELLKPLTTVVYLGATAQYLALFVHKPHRMVSLAYIHPYHQGGVPDPLTLRYLLVIIPFGHGDLSFLLCCFWIIQL